MENKRNGKACSNNRNGVIDLLKFIFSIMIVLYHSKSFSGQEQHIMTGGYIAVDFFFIVSGYYLAVSASAAAEWRAKAGQAASVGRDTFYYICKRLGRLYPEFITASLIALAARAVVFRWGIKEAAVNVIKAAGEWTFLQMAGFDTGGLIGAMWFLSAMLLASLLLYPFALKFKDDFFYYGAPVLFIFLFGYTYRTIAHFQSHATPVLGVANIGLTRAVMELSAGCFVFALVKELKKRQWGSLSRAGVTALEVLAFGAVIIYYAAGTHHNKIDWYTILLLILGVLITQTNLSYTASLIHGKCFDFLGSFSFDLYLSHRFWSLLINRMAVFSGLSYMQKIPVYLLLSFGTAFLVRAQKDRPFVPLFRGK